MAVTLTGNRALVYVNGALVGIFDSCNYTTSLGVDPIFILGASTAQEIAIHSQEVVNLNCTGFRVINHGAFTEPSFISLANLLTFNPLTITVVDRQTGATIMTALNCVPTTRGENYSAKSISKLQLSYMGTTSFDESGNTSESGAATLPV